MAHRALGRAAGLTLGSDEAMADPQPRTRPLLVRAGARFACSYGGGCCTDIHTIGPVTTREVARIRRLAPDAVVLDPVHEIHAMKVDAEGRCVMLAGGKCMLHAKGGPRAKPSTCREFPFALVATPAGGRVVTAHRCPCRTLGRRPPLSAQEAWASLSDANGRVTPARRISNRVPIFAHTTVSFRTYVEREAPMIDRLVKGDAPGDALGYAFALSAEDVRTWRAVARGFEQLAAVPSRQGQALGWFSIGMLGVLGEVRPATYARPWSDPYDRAEAGSKPLPAEQVLGDFLADQIWSFAWLDHGALDRARARLTALARVGTVIAERLIEMGVRTDRAAAEAVLALELAEGTQGWAHAVRDLRPSFRAAP